MSDEIDEELKKLDEKNNAPVPAKAAKKSDRGPKIAIGLLAIALGAIIILGADVDEFQGIQDWVFGNGNEPKEAIPNPAQIELYKFNDPHDNDSVNVEFWLINIGDEAGTAIEVFVRARDNNGTILFNDLVETTTLVLQYNETCSGCYTVEYENALYVTHTIEISWAIGRNSYQKKTIIVETHG